MSPDFSRDPAQAGPSQPCAAHWRRLLATALRRTGYGVVLLVIAGLLFAYLWPQWLSNQSTPQVLVAWLAFCLQTVQFHLGLALLPVLGVAMVARWWRLAGLAALPVLFTLGPVALSYLPRKPAPIPAGAPTLRVMTYNVLATNPRRREVIDVIEHAGADLVLLQEAEWRWPGWLDKALLPRFERLRDFTARRGLLAYARVPARVAMDANPRLAEDDVHCLRLELDLAGQRVVVYDVHLPNPLPNQLKRMRAQLATLLDLLAAEPRDVPLVVAGDFNAPATSPYAQLITALGLRDAWDEAGIGRGATWPAKTILRHFPGVRIDHIYLRGPIRCVAIRRGESGRSDHLPVIADLVLDKPK